MYCIICMHAHLLNRVWLFVTPWTVVRQAPLSMRFSRQEYWSRLPCPPPKYLPWPKDWTHISSVSCTGRQETFTTWPEKSMCRVKVNSMGYGFRPKVGLQEAINYINWEYWEESHCWRRTSRGPHSSFTSKLDPGNQMLLLSSPSSHALFVLRGASRM